MKPVYLTLFALALAVSPPASADEELPLLIEAPPQNCQPVQAGPHLESMLALCTRQAELGHAKAQYLLGNYWYDGILVEQDISLALHWYEQASSQGHADAQHRLGLMYARGEGVPVNRSQAYVILKMSAVNGSDDAFDASDRLEADMTPAEAQQANEVLSHLFRRYLRQIREDMQHEPAWHAP